MFDCAASRRKDGIQAPSEMGDIQGSGERIAKGGEEAANYTNPL